MPAEYQNDDRDFLARLGNRIREIRSARDLSQEKLGFASGRTQHYVSQLELGKRNMSIVTARAIAKALDVSLSDLLADL